MRKRICLWLILGSGLFPILAGAQSLKRRQVKDLPLTIIVPASFRPMPSVPGFQDDSTGSNIMFNILSIPYHDMLKEFTGDNKSVVILEQKQVQLGMDPGSLFIIKRITDPSKYTQQVLLFGHNASTIMAVASLQASDTAGADNTRTALLSTLYDSTLVTSDTNALSFHLDERGTQLIKSTTIGSSIVFNRRNEKKGQSLLENSVFIATGSYSRKAIEHQKDFALERLLQLPLPGKIVSKDTTAVIIDGLNGYEIIADNGIEQKIHLSIYMLILYSKKGGYYLLYGSTPYTDPAVLQDFKKISRSFRQN